ncbi:MAG: L-threonylcarbamoyladenylate synthase [Erysipelotrichaceae bacterium]
METKRYQPHQTKEILEILKRGGVVAFPTDTVYGLGVVYDQPQALDALKQAKGRPDEKPIPMMVASIEQLQQVALLQPQYVPLAKTYMPGALTLILSKKDSVPGYVTNHFPTIGIRIPNHPMILSWMELLDKPLLVSSANLSDHPTGATMEAVLEQLDGRIDAIVEGIPGGDQPSTIVDGTKEKAQILRVGKISKAQVEEAMRMKIAVGCDHGGLEYKNIIVKLLETMGHEVHDCGTYTHAAVDYVDHAKAVCQLVASNACERGIVICGTGVGMSIAANKHDKIRCALVSDIFTAHTTREHNDTNVLALGQRVLGEEVMKEIVTTWLATPFSNEARHCNRIEKIHALED